MSVLQVNGAVDEAAITDVKKPIRRTRAGNPKVKTGCTTCKYVFWTIIAIKSSCH
jgi:hypothetical protein